MIHPDSRTLEWIEKVARKNHVKDIALAEKAIRAFSLLEALVRSGCPLLFKGGTAEMLHLNSAKRLSIDIDIICPPGTQIEEYLKVYSAEYGFGDVELVERISRTDIPKKHAKYYYQVSYPAGSRQDKILQNGIGRVRSFIHSENYGLDSAIVNASKAAYLSKLIEKGLSEVRHFSSDNEQELISALIVEPLPTKFNKFKKSNIEAFFYWNEIQKIEQDNKK